jgi:hypothetical protein
MTAAGAILSTSPISSSFSCANSQAFSTLVTCQSGAWAAPASSLVEVGYLSSPACPVSTIAETAGSYPVGSCLNFGSGSVRASCTSSSYSIMSYTNPVCSGAGTESKGSIGCGRPLSGGGVAVWQCTASGAASASVATAAIALMLVAAASASAL